MSTQLIFIAVIVAAALGGAGYIKHLHSSVTSLTVERDGLVIQLDEATTAKEEVARKQEAAMQQVASVRSELAKARARVQYVEIPMACPDKIDWLYGEIAK